MITHEQVKDNTETQNTHADNLSPERGRERERESRSPLSLPEEKTAPDSGYEESSMQEGVETRKTNREREREVMMRS